MDERAHDPFAAHPTGPWRVLKFGGSSLATPEAMCAAAEIVRASDTARLAVVVVVDRADVQGLAADVLVGGGELEQAAPPGRAHTLLLERARVGLDVAVGETVLVELVGDDLEVGGVEVGGGVDARISSGNSPDLRSSRSQRSLIIRS